MKLLIHFFYIKIYNDCKNKIYTEKRSIKPFKYKIKLLHDYQVCIKLLQILIDDYDLD